MSLVNTYFDGSVDSTREELLGEIVGFGVFVNLGDGKSHVVKSNFYLNRGIGAYGTWMEEDEDYNEYYEPQDSFAFSPITTAAALETYLNAGRALVIADAFAHIAGEAGAEALLNSVVLHWTLRDGDHPLDCDGSLGVGLRFADINIGAPNTGGR